MKKAIVTTTINSPTQALLKYISFKDWDLFIVGDRKTPHTEYEALETNKNVKYLSPDYQEAEYKELSDAIGWNKIQRRTIGYLHVYKLGYDIIASVDDDNIPYDNWGADLYINKEVETYYYTNESIVFDPISVTNYEKLWHRGYPVQLLTTKNKNEIKIKKIVPQIQANFWNGDPDIDAFCRLEHKPNCVFNDGDFPFTSDKISPFNSQNTFLSRKIANDYFLFPHIGRMDDIWASYYILAKGYKVIYNKATVVQDRNDHNLIEDLKKEYIGYENNLSLVKDLYNDSEKILNYLPERSIAAWNIYRSLLK